MGTIESIEQHELIALGEQERLPFLPRWLARNRSDRLHDHRLGPATIPVAALEDIGFAALDVDLQEVDAGHAMLPAQLCKAEHGHPDGPIWRAQRACGIGMFFAAR